MKITKLIAGFMLGWMIILLIQTAVYQNAIAQTTARRIISGYIPPGFNAKPSFSRLHEGLGYSALYTGPGGTCFIITGTKKRTHYYRDGDVIKSKTINTPLFGEVSLEYMTSQQASGSRWLMTNNIYLEEEDARYQFRSGGQSNCKKHITFKEAEKIIMSMKRA